MYSEYSLVNIYSFHIVEGRVQVEVFKDCSSSSSTCFSKMDTSEPDYIRNVYNFGIPPYHSSSMTYIGFRLKTYLVAPMSGTYVFAVSTNENCILYFGDSESSKQEIIVSPYLTYGSIWSSSSKKSTQVLVEGKKYYMEARQYENVGSIWLKVSMQLPNGVKTRVSQKYLVAYP